MSNKKKTSILIVILTFFIFTLSGCFLFDKKDKTTNIDLSDGVRIVDKSLSQYVLKIGSTVEFEVIVPEGEELVSFFVDGIDKKEQIIDNKLTLKITKEMKINAVFNKIDDGKEEDNRPRFSVTLESKDLLYSDDELSKIPQGTIVTIKVRLKEHYEVDIFKVDGEYIDLKGKSEYKLEVTKNHTIYIYRNTRRTLKSF